MNFAPIVLKLVITYTESVKAAMTLGPGDEWEKGGGWGNGEGVWRGGDYSANLFWSLKGTTQFT